MLDFNNVLFLNDQPVTCPKCGARTEIILDLSHTRNRVQIHECLRPDCKNEFVTEEEDEIEY